MKKLFLVAALLLAGAVSAHAQTPTVQPGEKVRLAWEHDGLQGAQFRLYLDGTVIKNFAATDLVLTAPVAPATDTTYTTVDGVIPVFTTAQIGAHTFAVSAYNAAGESAKISLAINVNWTSAPTPPKNLRIFNVKIALNEETGEMKLYLLEDKGQ